LVRQKLWGRRERPVKAIPEEVQKRDRNSSRRVGVKEEGRVLEEAEGGCGGVVEPICKMGLRSMPVPKEVCR
jgi:hypothetical protein